MYSLLSRSRQKFISNIIVVKWIYLNLKSEEEYLKCYDYYNDNLFKSNFAFKFLTMNTNYVSRIGFACEHGGDDWFIVVFLHK